MFLRRILVDDIQRVGEIELKGFHPELEEEKHTVQLTVDLLVHVPRSITQELIETALGPLVNEMSLNIAQLSDDIGESRFQITYITRDTLPMDVLNVWQQVFQEKVINPNKSRIDYRQ